MGTSPPADDDGPSGDASALTLGAESSAPPQPDSSSAPALSPDSEVVTVSLQVGASGGDPTIDLALPPAETAQPDPPVSRVGEYDILGEIARGGMGVVYRARQTRLNRVVALKMILAGQLASAVEIQRFYTEAAAAAALDHSGIVPVYEVGQHGSQHFFSMALVDGQSLHERIKAGPLPPREAARIVSQVASAVHYAHSKGIVHRDLKPQNILLDAEGHPKVTDFGLAKRLNSDNTPESGELTRTGAVLGTPSYMPPEQAKGETSKLGPLVDVYSLGAVLYATLTGRPPFQAASLLELLSQVIDREPASPRLLNDAIPADLETICLKCLQKDPARRYAAAAELGEDLDRFLRGEVITARPASQWERTWRWCRRNPLLATLWGTLAAVLVGVAVASSAVALEMMALASSETSARKEAQDKTKEAVKAAEREQEAKRLALSKGAELRAALSKQYVAQGSEALDAGDFGGALLWFTHALELDADDPTRGQVHRLRIANTLRALPRLTAILFHDAPLSTVEFSPDGARIATASYDGAARLWDAATGQPIGQPFVHESYVYDVTFSPDGELLATASGDRTVRIWNARTGEAVGEPIQHCVAVNHVAFSADSQRLVTAGGCRDHLSSPPAGSGPTPPGEALPGLPVAVVWNRAQQTITPLQFTESGVPLYAVFSPDGRQVLTAGHTLLPAIWDAATGQRLHGPFAVGGTVTAIAFSADGKRIVTGERQGTTRVWDVATQQMVGKPLPTFGADLELLAEDRLRVDTAVWDLKTGQVATSAMPGVELRHRIALDGGVAQLVSTTRGLQVRAGANGEIIGCVPTPSTLARLSPNGRRVIAVNADSRQGTAFLWDAAGAAPAHPPLGHWVRSVAYHPDGKQLLTGSWIGVARTWDLETGRATGPPINHPKACHALYHPEGTEVVTIGSDYTIRRWDQASGAPRGHLIDCPGFIHPHTVQFSSDRRTLLGSVLPSNDQSGHVHACGWDVATGQPRWPSFDVGYRGVHLTVSPTRPLFATGSSSHFSRIYSVETGQPTTPKLEHDYFINTPAFSPDMQLLATPGGDRLVRLWDVATGEARGALAHDGLVNSVRFTRDGNLVTAASDGLRVWDVAARRTVGGIIAPGENMVEILISPDDRWILSISEARQLRLWDIKTGETLGPSWSLVATNHLPAFRPDSQQLTYVGEGRAALLHDLRPDERPVAQLVALAALLSGQRLGRWETIESIPAADFRTLAAAHRAAHPVDWETPETQVKTWRRVRALRAYQGSAFTTSQTLWADCQATEPDDVQLRSVCLQAAYWARDPEQVFAQAMEIGLEGQLSQYEWQLLDGAYPTADMETALVRATAAIQSRPHDPALLTLQGWLLSMRGRQAEAAEALEQAIAHGARGDVCRFLGHVRTQQGRFAEAAQQFAAATDDYRAHIGSNWNWLAAELAAGDAAGARRDWEEIRRRFAKAPDPIANQMLAWFGLVHFDLPGAAGVKMMQTALQASPQSPYFLRTSALAHLRAGDLPAARQRLDAAQAINPTVDAWDDHLLRALIACEASDPIVAREQLAAAHAARKVAAPGTATWQDRVSFEALVGEVERRLGQID